MQNYYSNNIVPIKKDAYEFLRTPRSDEKHRERPVSQGGEKVNEGDLLVKKNWKKMWEYDWTLLIPETHKESGNIFWMVHYLPVFFI